MGQKKDFLTCFTKSSKIGISRPILMILVPMSTNLRSVSSIMERKIIFFASFIVNSNLKYDHFWPNMAILGIFLVQLSIGRNGFLRIFSSNLNSAQWPRFSGNRYQDHQNRPRNAHSRVVCVPSPELLDFYQILQLVCTWKDNFDYLQKMWLWQV